MRLKRRRSGLGRLAIALLVAGPLHAQERSSALNDFLVRSIGLSGSQLSALARGEAAGKLLPTADERDIAAFGAIRIDVPRAFFVDRQRDVPRALLTPSRGEAHVFSNPAADADVRTVDITADDVKELRACRPSSCNFKLPATDMDALRTIDLSGPSAPRDVAAYARRRIVDYVTDYRRRGNEAMVTYDDGGGVRASEAFAAMLGDSSYAFRVVPSAGRFLLQYPRDSLPGGTDVIFWAIDALPHVRRVLRIMHEVIYSPPEIPGLTLLAAKQIYADHYFEAGLEVTTAVDRAEAGAASADSGITVVAIRRYRFDRLPGGGLLNLRGRLRDGLQSNLIADLTRLKRDSETAWRSARSR